MPKHKNLALLWISKHLNSYKPPASYAGILVSLCYTFAKDRQPTQQVHSHPCWWESCAVWVTIPAAVAWLHFGTQHGRQGLQRPMKCQPLAKRRSCMQWQLQGCRLPWRASPGDSSSSPAQPISCDSVAQMRGAKQTDKHESFRQCHGHLRKSDATAQHLQFGP